MLRAAMLVLALMATACTSHANLSAELVTDLVSGEEGDFDRVRVDFAKGALTGAPDCRKKSDLLSARQNYQSGAQVGPKRQVNVGEVWLVRVALCDRGRLLVHRTVRAKIEQDTELRVVIAQGCFENENGCGGKAPCNYQTCEESIDCHWGNLDACESPECGEDQEQQCARGFECWSGDCLRRRPKASGSADGAIDGPEDAGGPDALAEGSEEADADAETAAPPDSSTATVPQPDAGPPREAPGQPYSAQNKARVLYVGDALAIETAATVEDKVTHRSTDATKLLDSVEYHEALAERIAICDFLEGRPTKVPPEVRLAAQIKAQKPHVVVMQFWGDARSECMAGASEGPAYFERYKADAEQAVSQIARAALEVGIERPLIMWVLQGPDKANNGRPRMLNGIYADTARAFRDATIDAGNEVSGSAYVTTFQSPEKRYEWTQYALCNSWEVGKPRCLYYAPTASWVVQLHRSATDPMADPYYHQVLFCVGSTLPDYRCDTLSAGIDRYGSSIAFYVKRALGLAQL